MYVRVHELHPIVSCEGAHIFSFQDGVLLAMLGALPTRGCWSGQVANLE